jgi:hypothetical protein
MTMKKDLYLYERIDGECVRRASGSGRYCAILMVEFRAAGLDVFVSADPSLGEAAMAARRCRKVEMGSSAAGMPEAKP